MEMTERACPLCKSVNASKMFADANFDGAKLEEFSFASRKIPEYGHYRLFLCQKCDLVYANPVPAFETLAKRYSDSDFDSEEESYCASETYGRFLSEIIKELPDIAGVIDIGTGNGVFLEKLISLGFTNVTGVEPSTNSIAAAKDEIRGMIKEGVFNSEDFDDEAFRLITCFQVLEHLYDPLEMCRIIHNKLKKGAVVFFVCHNHRSLSRRILGQKSPIFDVEHLQLFSRRSLTLLLEQSGFTDIKTRFVLNRYPLHYWVKLFPLPKKIKLFCIALLKKIKIGYLPLSIPAGNIAVIGYKRS